MWRLLGDPGPERQVRGRALRPVASVSGRGRKGGNGPMNELAVDYCCGGGGWSVGFADAGFDVLGFDIKPQPKYRHEFILADIRDLHGTALPRVPRVVVGSA